MTAQGLGGRSVATEAGNPVLCDVGFYRKFSVDFSFSVHVTIRLNRTNKPQIFRTLLASAPAYW